MSFESDIKKKIVLKVLDDAGENFHTQESLTHYINHEYPKIKGLSRTVATRYVRLLIKEGKVARFREGNKTYLVGRNAHDFHYWRDLGRKQGVS